MVKTYSLHIIYIQPTGREKRDIEGQLASFLRTQRNHIPLARGLFPPCTHIYLQERLRYGITKRKKGRLDLGMVAFSPTAFQIFKQSSYPWPHYYTSPSRRIHDTNLVAFFGFYSANRIAVLTFPILDQDSDFLKLLYHLKLIYLLSNFQNFMAVVFSLSLFPWRFIAC